MIWPTSLTSVPLTNCNKLLHSQQLFHQSHQSLLPCLFYTFSSMANLKGHDRSGDTGEWRSYLSPPAVPQLLITASGNRILVQCLKLVGASIISHQLNGLVSAPWRGQFVSSSLSVPPRCTITQTHTLSPRTEPVPAEPRNITLGHITKHKEFIWRINMSGKERTTQHVIKQTWKDKECFFGQKIVLKSNLLIIFEF